MEKRLTRTVGMERKFLGVCGGIALFFGIDATLVRLAFAVFAFFAFTGVFVYLICAFVIPEDDGMIRTEYKVKREDNDKDDRFI